MSSVGYWTGLYIHALLLLFTVQVWGVINEDWKRYKSKNNGRHDFQIDLGIALLNYGIGLDWVGDERPDYMRTGEFIPCDCKKCYFCLNGHTTGIAHAGRKQRSGRRSAQRCV